MWKLVKGRKWCTAYVFVRTILPLSAGREAAVSGGPDEAAACTEGTSPAVSHGPGFNITS